LTAEIVFYVMSCVRWVELSAPTFEIEDIRTVDRLCEIGSSAKACGKSPWRHFAIRWPLGALVGDDARHYRGTFFDEFSQVHIGGRVELNPMTGRTLGYEGGRFADVSAVTIAATDGCSLWRWQAWPIADLLSRPSSEGVCSHDGMAVYELRELDTDHAIRERVRLACRGLLHLLPKVHRRFHPSPFSAPKASNGAPKAMRPILVGRREIEAA
jgi:hypothetical protein